MPVGASVLTLSLESAPVLSAEVVGDVDEAVVLEALLVDGGSVVLGPEDPLVLPVEPPSSAAGSLAHPSTSRVPMTLTVRMAAGYQPGNSDARAHFVGIDALARDT